MFHLLKFLWFIMVPYDFLCSIFLMIFEIQTIQTIQDFLRCARSKKFKLSKRSHICIWFLIISMILYYSLFIEKLDNQRIEHHIFMILWPETRSLIINTLQLYLMLVFLRVPQFQATLDVQASCGSSKSQHRQCCPGSKHWNQTLHPSKIRR